MQKSNRAIQELIARLQAESGGPPPPPPPLNTPNSGGGSEGLEGRVAKLEAQVEHAVADLAKLAGVPADLASLRTQVDNLPTKDYLADKFDRQLRLTGIVVAIIAAVFGGITQIIG